jgi:hypothetical protein
LAVAAVALGAIRVFVVVEIAIRRYAVGLAQGGAIVVFAALCVLWGGSAVGIAQLYVAISCAFVPISALILLGSRPRLSGFFQSTGNERKILT